MEVVVLAMMVKIGMVLVMVMPSLNSLALLTYI